MTSPNQTYPLYPLPCGCWQLRLPDGREMPAHDVYALERKRNHSVAQALKGT